MKDTIRYLRPYDETGLGAINSKLLSLLGDAKMARAPGKQWISFINSLGNKGVKKAEIDDSSVLTFLGTKGDERVTREEVVQWLRSRLPTVKLVDLNAPRYAGWRSISAGSYKERLYILASEAMLADDEIDDIMYSIEQLGFDPSPLLEDPELVDRLEARLTLVRSQRDTKWDFSAHHFSNEVSGHGKNLMAHARFIHDPAQQLFFVQEIQSDWAQKGRRTNWASGYPRAPFVTDTESWATVVVRDLLHTAACNEEAHRVAWLRANMRNGWDGSDSADPDGLAEFYDSIVRRMIEKAISKFGGRVVEMEVQTKHGPRQVLGFEMTDQVRQGLRQAYPLYSHGNLLTTMQAQALADPQRAAEVSAVLNECREMLGDVRTVRFVARLVDITTGRQVAGQYLNQGITLSLRAKDLPRAARHESWHFASENLLLAHERREIRLAFSAVSPLNEKTQAVLRSLGEEEAARQCVDHNECAAHAFSLWAEGRLSVQDEPRNVFEVVASVLARMSSWLERKVFGVDVKSPNELFEALRGGVLAARQSAVSRMESASQEEGAQEASVTPSLHG